MLNTKGEGESGDHEPSRNRRSDTCVARRVVCRSRLCWPLRRCVTTRRRAGGRRYLHHEPSPCPHGQPWDVTVTFTGNRVVPERPLHPEPPHLHDYRGRTRRSAPTFGPPHARGQPRAAAEPLIRRRAVSYRPVPVGERHASPVGLCAIHGCVGLSGIV